MDGAQFAKMLSDKHLFELNRMEYKYSTVSVKEFAELLRQNFAQPLPLTDFLEISCFTCRTSATAFRSSKSVAWQRKMSHLQALV